MNPGGQSILVTGATGHQGGAVARHLLADGWRVRAFTRDAQSPAARTLAGLGAEVVEGDLLDRASIDAAVDGAYGVYSVQSLAGGSDAEKAEALALADAAKAAGVRHFVYSSVRGADVAGGMPWVASKHEIEAYLRGLDLPLTIWRPVTFMENYLRDKGDLLGGHLRRAMPADTVWPDIAVDDIGRFVALSFADPESWIGRATPVAGDATTFAEKAVAFSRVLGRPVEFERIAPAEGMPTPPPAPPGSPEPEHPDLAYLRTLIPDLTSLEEWARAQDWTAE